MSVKPIEEFHCETVSDFLQQISLSTPPFNRKRWAESPWAFRGNGDSFPLVPSALRPKTRLITFGSSGRWSMIQPGYATYEHRAECELYTLRVFFQMADRHGLPLPEDSQLLRHSLISTIDRLKDEGEHWPPMDLLSLMAIAQHHGVPTRLLDWSTDPLTAAYFAAEDASRRVRKEIENPQNMRLLDSPANWPASLANKRLEVWAINLVEALGSQADDDAGLGSPHIRVVAAPRAGNENLYAQRGLFTLPTEIGPPDWDSRDPYVVVPLEEMVLKWRTLYGESPFLVRVTLPLCCGPALMRALVGHGVTAARLFPGFDGVVKALRERDYFHANFADYSFI